MKRMLLVVLCMSTSAIASVHHTKAQAAYFAENQKCTEALRTAKKEAKAAPADQRRKLAGEAKEAYRRCEHHAHLVWKYYPLPPPPDSPPPQ